MSAGSQGFLIRPQVASSSGNRAARTWTGTHMGYWPCKQQIILLSHYIDQLMTYFQFIFNHKVNSPLELNKKYFSSKSSLNDFISIFSICFFICCLHFIHSYFCLFISVFYCQYSLKLFNCNRCCLI